MKFIPKKAVFVILLCAVSFVAGWFAGRHFTASDKPKKKSVASVIFPVRVMEVKPEQLKKKVSFVGNIRARYEADVFPKVSGKVMEKTKKEGDSVAKDEALMFIDRDEVGLKYEKAPVDSPLTGTVGLVYVDVGQKVSTNAPVAYVVDMEQVKVSFDIPEVNLANIAVGKEAEISVDTYPDRVFEGVISKIAPVLDPLSRTSQAEIVIDNPDHLLRPGMFARIAIVTQTSDNVLAIMREAVIGREPDTYVFVAQDGKAVKKKVTLGLKENNIYEVSSGLAARDLVVIMGQQKLYENAPVIPEKMESSAAGQETSKTP
jgi:multidrug efflux pump subunit AcrA (membrane-fusion protein)